MKKKVKPRLNSESSELQNFRSTFCAYFLNLLFHSAVTLGVRVISPTVGRTYNLQSQ